MLNLVEKVVAGFGGLCALLTLGLYLLLGIRTTQPDALVPAVQNKPTLATSKQTPTTNAAADEPILAALKKQGRPVRKSTTLRREGKVVPKPLFEAVSEPANWMQQLKKVRSEQLRTPRGLTRLKLYDIHEDSYLNRFDFRNDDIIELIDGEIVPFEESASTRLHSMFQEKLSKLERGEKISVTLTRRGNPVHIEFEL